MADWMGASVGCLLAFIMKIIGKYSIFYLIINSLRETTALLIFVILVPGIEQGIKRRCCNPGKVPQSSPKSVLAALAAVFSLEIFSGSTEREEKNGLEGDTLSACGLKSTRRPQ